ncbi:MAG TPA: serine hydrolase domain-containing protein [Pyrinomonadaceae bacterium]|nr:serine hydrolase domain-containing protein [Pyrinomonadaceae bacterium]
MKETRNSAKFCRLISILITASFLLASHISGGSATAKGTRDPRASRVDALFGNRNRKLSPGLAIAVVRDGKVILRRGYGFASIEHRVPITPSTVFDVASLSKQFTGLAVAMLITEGKIKLSDDIRKYIPELPDFGRPITIDHLLHHTSGLRDWPSTLSVAGWLLDDVITFKQILTMAYNQHSLNFVPGSEYDYSNTGYNLLAEMVQRVTGRSFRLWNDEHIFRPLGMVSTHVCDDYNEVIANRAFGYTRGPNGTYRSTPNHLTGLGSSSIFSTVDDFSRWLINFGDAAVGGKAALSLMLTPGKLNDGTAVRYGYGITGSSRYKGLPFFTSSGAWASFNSFDAYFPEQKFGVVVLANADSNVIDAQQAVIKITDIYLENDFTIKPPPQPASASAEPVVNLSPAVLDEYAGLYRPGPHSYIRIQRYGTMLLFQEPHKGHSLMSPKSETEFVVSGEDDETTIVFHRDAASKVASLTYGDQQAPRVDNSEARPPADLAQYAGDYDSEELGTSYRVIVKDGALQMQHRRRGTIPLTWLWREEFGSPDAYIASIDFERDNAGRVTALVINGSARSRDIRFKKRQ